MKGSGISVSWRYVLLCFFSRSSIRVRSLIKKQSIVQYRVKIYIFFFSFHLRYSIAVFNFAKGNPS